jgi:hypothetical protein
LRKVSLLAQTEKFVEVFLLQPVRFKEKASSLKFFYSNQLFPAQGWIYLCMHGKLVIFKEKESSLKFFHSNQLFPAWGWICLRVHGKLVLFKEKRKFVEVFLLQPTFPCVGLGLLARAWEVGSFL